MSRLVDQAPGVAQRALRAWVKARFLSDLVYETAKWYPSLQEFGVNIDGYSFRLALVENELIDAEALDAW